MNDKYSIHEKTVVDGVPHYPCGEVGKRCELCQKYEEDASLCTYSTSDLESDYALMQEDFPDDELTLLFERLLKLRGALV